MMRMIISPKYLPTLETLLVALGMRSAIIMDLVHAAVMKLAQSVRHKSPGTGTITIADTASVLSFKLLAQTV